jgi:hypothetical protein
MKVWFHSSKSDAEYATWEVDRFVKYQSHRIFTDQFWLEFTHIGSQITMPLLYCRVRAHAPGL